MKAIRPRNWRDFQHYKNRSPVWIKLHKRLLDDYDFQCLQLASKALAPMLWLLASEYDDGAIPAEPRKIAFRLHVTLEELSAAFEPLLTHGFFEIIENGEILASATLADCQQPASLEKEKKETQVTSNKKLPPTPPSKNEGGKRAARKRPEAAHPIGDYRPGDGAKEKAITYWKSKGRTDLPAHVDREAELFLAHHKRAGTLGVDWDAGWQTWYVRAVEITRPMNGTSNGNGASRLGFRDGPVRDRAAEYAAKLKAEKAKPPDLLELDPEKPP